MISITTIQGWLVWTAVYARWLMRYEAIGTLPSDIATAVLQRFYACPVGLEITAAGDTATRGDHNYLRMPKGCFESPRQTAQGGYAARASLQACSSYPPYKTGEETTR